MQTVDLDDRGSFAWMSGDRLRRASAAVALDGGGLLLVDPVDVPGLDERVAAAGAVAAVTYLIDRHSRDADAVAARLGAPVQVPAVLAGRGEPLDVRGVQERVVLAAPGWHESALWVPDRRLLVVPEALGTALYWLAGPAERLGVHPLLRLRPPAGALAGLDPAAIAVGHGAPVVDGAAEALRAALASARRGLPKIAGRIVTGAARRTMRRP